MNNKDIFFSLSCNREVSIAERMEDLLRQYKDLLQTNQLQNSELVFSRIYFSDLKNQFGPAKNSTLYTQHLNKTCISYIEQPPLDSSKITIILWFCRNANNKREGNNASLSCIDMHGHQHIFQSIRYSEEESKELGSEAQTIEAFNRHKTLLESKGLNLADNCQRTWLFVRDIDYNYGGIVTGRNKIFRKENLTHNSHYIASTGIGGQGYNNHTILCSDFYSIEGIKPEQIKYLRATNYLNPTYEYGVAFERGTEIDFEDVSYYFISGTASIDKHGDCIYKGDVQKQMERLFLNISKLLEEGKASLDNLKTIIVYLRDISDYKLVKTYIDEHFPNIPKVITEARVCRPEWLIEVECIAMK